MIRNIIWDLDGTLTYTLQDLCNSVNHALSVFGMPERSLDEVRSFVGNGVRRLMVQAVPEGEGNPRFEDCFAEFKRHYKLHCKDNTRLYEGVAEALSELHAIGIRMAIVSNKLQAGVDELYEQWFRDTIDVAIGERPEMNRKPAPDMVHLAMAQLGCTADDTVYVGDSEVDVATARNSGLRCISVLWGFRDRECLEENGANVFVESPKEIVNMVTDENSKL